MSTPFDNFNKMYQSLEKSLRIAESFSSAMPNFYSALSAVNSPAIVATTNALSSAKLVATTNALSSAKLVVTSRALNPPGVIASTNAFSNASAVHAARCLSSSTFLSKAIGSCASVSRNMLEATALPQKLAKQLTLPPVYSASSITAEMSSRIVNPVSGVFTPEFSNLAAEIREMPLDTFEYSFDDAGNASISEQLEEKLSTIIDVNSTESSSHKKIISKEFFYSVILPIVLALLQLSCSMHSDDQSTKQLERHHQEEMSIQRQILSEECQQTEYLRKIFEATQDSIPAKEDGPSPQAADKQQSPKQH